MQAEAKKTVREVFLETQIPMSADDLDKLDAIRRGEEPDPSEYTMKKKTEIYDLPKPVSRCSCTVYHETDVIPTICNDCGRSPIKLEDNEVERMIKSRDEYLDELKKQKLR